MFLVHALLCSTFKDRSDISFATWSWKTKKKKMFSNITSSPHRFRICKPGVLLDELSFLYHALWCFICFEIKHAIFLHVSCFPLVDKPHEILWKNRARTVFFVSTGCDPSNSCFTNRVSTHRNPIPRNWPPPPPWMRRKWVVSGRHARICHRHCGGSWVWWEPFDKPTTSRLEV